MTGCDVAVAGLHVSRETLNSLRAFAAAVVAENKLQNLISGNSEGDIWERHIADSAQLLRFVGDSGTVLDLGTGAGFPGIVIAMLRPGPIVMVEPRARRAEFLQRQIDRFDLTHARLEAKKVESVEPFETSAICARAFAPLARLLPLAARFATAKTRWVLPKGKSAMEELASIQSTWHGHFRIEPSQTDPSCGIIVATGIKRRA